MIQCHYCSAKVADNAEKCSACQCPTDRAEAYKFVYSRYMRSRVASENAIETIGSLRKIFYVNAVLLTLGAVGALLSDTAPLIIILAVIQLVFAAVLAFFAYKFTSNPLGFSIAGLILSLIGFGSLFGIIAIVCMIACIVISIRYKKSLEETRRLEAIVQKLKQ